MAPTASSATAEGAGSRRRRRDLDWSEEEDEDGDDPGEPRVAPILLSAEHRSIGWMCGEPMADYAHVVFQARE